MVCSRQSKNPVCACLKQVAPRREYNIKPISEEMSRVRQRPEDLETGRLQVVLWSGLFLVLAFHSRVIYLDQTGASQNVAERGSGNPELLEAGAVPTDGSDESAGQPGAPPRDDSSPRTDLWEGKDRYVLHMDIPGASRSELDVKFADHRLTVRGDREETDEAADGGRKLQSERAGGSFSRMVMLPGGVNSAGVRAEYDEGVLTVRIPKGDEDTPRIDIPVD